jgi:chromosomal replication initiator protein
MIDAIQNFTMTSFKEKYRGADVLLIDDIQFIAGKEATQEEFFHTFSYLYESNRHIILTSDRPPNEIKPLEERIRTRFEGGLIADIQPPSVELRTAIIRKKSDALGLRISPELVDYMAERLHENIRQIEGVIKKLHALRGVYGDTDVTKDSIDRAISFIDPGNVPIDILIERIIMKVSSHFGVAAEDIKGRKKTSAISNSRHVCCYIIRKLTDKSFKEIGNIFGRDHTSVMHSCERVETDIKTVKNKNNEIKKLIKEIKEM